MTTQVTTTPVYDKTAFLAELANFKLQTDKVLAEAEALLVDSDESDVLATEVGKRIKTASKAVDDQKEATWRPYKKAADEISQAFKPLADSLERAEVVLKGKMLNYRQQKRVLEEARIAEERKQREDAALDEAAKIIAAAEQNAATAREGAAKRIEQLRAEGKVELADRLQAIAEEQIGKLVTDNEATAEKVVTQAANAKVEQFKTTTRSESGQSYITKTWDFEVTDAALVPREFCQPNEVAIRMAVRGGNREIAGVRIFEKENISIR